MEKETYTKVQKLISEIESDLSDVREDFKDGEIKEDEALKKIRSLNKKLSPLIEKRDKLLTSKQKRFVEKAFREDVKLVYDYSGRGMFGKMCPAVYCEHGEFGFKGALQDSLGLRCVVYCR